MKTSKIALLPIALLFLTGWNWTGLVSVSSTGVQANAPADATAVSADGRYVAFQSRANTLVPNDTNGEDDVFVHDTVTGTTTRVSVSSAGDEGVGGPSFAPAISADGRYVAFHSGAGNLVPDDTNYNFDIFVHDTVSGTTSRVSVSSTGDEAVNGGSFDPAISGDGRYVAFSSRADNLVAGDTNEEWDIFLRDTVNGTTTRVNRNQSVSSHEPAISADGRYVAFRTLSPLVPADSNGRYDIYVYDTVSGVTTLASVDSEGNQAIGDLSFGGTKGVEPAISADGRYVAFPSSAANLVADDTNAAYDIFVHDMVDGTTTRVNVDSAGLQATGGGSFGASISGDGRYVAFYSDANNLVADDINGLSDIFVHDRVKGTTSRVSLDQAGVESMGGGSYRPAISVDGRYVAFHTWAANLVDEDTNSQPDIVTRAIPEVVVTSVAPRRLPRGATTSVTIEGTNFLAGAFPDLGDVQASNVVIVDENTMTADATVPAGTPIGAHDVSIGLPGTGPGPQTGSVGVCADCITVPPGC